MVCGRADLKTSGLVVSKVDTVWKAGTKLRDRDGWKLEGRKPSAGQLSDLQGDADLVLPTYYSYLLSIYISMKVVRLSD